MQDLVLRLDFTPRWARKSPEEVAFAEEETGPAEKERPSRGERERRRRPPRERPRGQPQGGPRGEKTAGRGEEGRRPPPARLPVYISFLPDRQQLIALVRHIQASKRAFPLELLAQRLLARPEFHLVKIEARGEITLWQFKPDGAVFVDAESLRAHAILRHLTTVYEEIVEKTEPPAGQFTCVGRCTLSGEWLGPPNYHGYQERLMDLHRTRFPHMKIDEYRACIEMVRDPAAIEQWKEQASTRRMYRPKDRPDARLLTREEAVQEYLQRYLPSLQESGRRFIMPAARVRDLPESPLRRQIEEAWQKESRHPFTMILALRPALRHMRMHFFKAGKSEVYVTAVNPRPIEPRFAVENIRKMLELIRDHPGWNRAQLLEHLEPGLAPQSDRARELLAPLTWLVEKGHVIEFFDGTFAAPLPEKSGPPPAARNDQLRGAPAAKATHKKSAQPSPAVETVAAADGTAAVTSSTERSAPPSEEQTSSEMSQPAPPSAPSDQQ